jgi:hypothetical protein
MHWSYCFLILFLQSTKSSLKKVVEEITQPYVDQVRIYFPLNVRTVSFFVENLKATNLNPAI